MATCLPHAAQVWEPLLDVNVQMDGFGWGVHHGHLPLHRSLSTLAGST